MNPRSYSILCSALSSISSVLEPLKAQNRTTRFMTASQDASLIKEYSRNVEQALTDYQVCFCTFYFTVIINNQSD
jgi:hypothetical protein